jgi:hypothetical protein
MQERPDRTAFLLHQEAAAGGDLFAPRWVRTALDVRSGSPVTLRVGITPEADHPGMQAYASTGAQEIVQPVEAGPGSTTDVELELGLEGSGAGSARHRLDLAPGPHEVVVGLRRPDTGEHWQRRYDVFADPDGTVTVVLPGVGEHILDFGQGPRPFAQDVGPVIAER